MRDAEYLAIIKSTIVRSYRRDPTVITVAVSFVANTISADDASRMTEHDWEPDEIGERAAAGILA